MNHQPFEAWLLDDKLLTQSERRELDSHLQTCAHCAALAETGLALRSTRVVAPVAGFTVRFQQRLAMQKIAERRQKLWGLFVLIFAGLGLFGWLAAPYIYEFVHAPVEWLAAGIGYFLFIFTSIQAVIEVASVLLRIVPDFMHPYVWVSLVSALAGIGLLWIASIWRLARAPQGVSV